ncbi:hypothetical protein TNCV_2617701 [Trichonephila clavipes]|nr:hypothetical protein TNCV_2617701 [Trichonephila clavipes]
MIQDCNPSSNRLSSSDHVFLATVLLSALVRSRLPVVARSSSVYSPNLVCMVRPVVRCRQQILTRLL